MPINTTDQGASRFISVVVPVYDRPYEVVKGCVGALLAADYPSFELIVVEDGSAFPYADCLQRDLAGESKGRLRFHRIPHSGAPVARAAGFSVARGELVATTDDDCMVDQGWLTALDRAVSGDIGAVGGLTLSYFGNGIVASFCDATGTLKEPITSSTGHVQGLYTANACFLRQALESVHGMNGGYAVLAQQYNVFVIGFEDWDLSQRLLAGRGKTMSF